jgi:hypothetical protein
MRRAAVGLALVCAACSSGGGGGGSGSHAAAADLHARIKRVTSFVTYYGAGHLAALGRYDLAIIQPSTLTPGEVHGLERRGTLVVCYLTIGEVDPGDPGLADGTIKPGWLLGTNHNWGSRFANANVPGWRRLVVHEAGDLLAQGYDGLFLDTVDTAEEFPKTAPGMVELIRELHAAYPRALLVQNRGFTVIGRTAPYVDAVMFEDLSTDYDFNRLRYIPSPYMADNRRIARQLAALHRRTGMPILALDYAGPSQRAMALHAVAVARSYGFLSSVSTIDLNTLPSAP